MVNQGVEPPDVRPSNSFEFGYRQSQLGDTTSNTVTIAGINTSITLRIEQVANDGYDYLSVNIFNGVSTVETEITSLPYTFNVSNENQVWFYCILTREGNVFLYDVYNESDGDDLLTDQPTGFEWISGGG